MKKKLALMLTCVLVVLSISACKKTTPVEQSTTVEPVTQTTTQAKPADTTPVPVEAKLVVSWWGNQVRNERTQAALDLYTEQNPNITFDGQFAEWADYWNKLATASAGHNLPDIVQMDYKYLQQYVSNDLLLDLTPYIESGVLDLSSVGEGIVKSGTVDGGVYALCIGVNAPSLFYNKTLLDGAGITIKDNMTTAEFMDVCSQVYKKTGYKTNIAYGNGDNFIDYALRGIGVQLFKADKLGATSADQLEEFFNFYEIGMKEGWHVDPSIFAERTIGSVEQDPLVYGSTPDTRSWCAFAYSNQLTATQKAAPEGTVVGITTWPSANPKASNYLKPGQFFSVSVDSKNPEEAAKVLNYVTNAVDCNEILLAERGVPAASTTAAAIAPKLDEITNVVISFINNVVTPNCSTINPPAPDSATEVFDLIDQIVERLCYSEISSKEAAQELFEQGNQIMQSKK